MHSVRPIAALLLLVALPSATYGQEIIFDCLEGDLSLAYPSQTGVGFDQEVYQSVPEQIGGFAVTNITQRAIVFNFNDPHLPPPNYEFMTVPQLATRTVQVRFKYGFFNGL